MRNLTFGLEDLRDAVDASEHEISVLGQITRELTSILGLGDDAGADPLIRRHLAEIRRRMAVALDRQTSLANALEEYGRDLRSEASAGSEELLLH